MLSMALQAFYNIVDSVFVANIPDIGEQATTALTLAYPIQMLMVSFIVGTGVGANVLLSRCLGEGNQERANQTAGTTILMILGLIALEMLASPLADLFGLSDQTRSHYISISRIASIGFLFAGANIALQSGFQALAKGLYSVVVSLGRQLVFILPVAYGFSRIALVSPDQSWLIWTTFIIGEVLTLSIAALMMRQTLRDLDSRLDP